MKTEKRRNQTKRSKTLKRLSMALSALVVFVASYALILPAITMETPTSCGKAEHIHGADCYSPILICGYEQTPEVTLLSGPETVSELICPLEEHVHDETCLDGEGNLICGKEEHQHGDACYSTVELEPEEPVHVHTSECFSYVLTCREVEHQHSMQCYSDPNADTDASAWESAADKALEKLTAEEQADARTRLLAVVKALESYSESQQNYLVAEDGTTKYGYTMFGAAYGLPYGEWNALFVDWALQRAAVPGFPLGANADDWAKTLMDSDETLGTSFVKHAEPRIGDLVFLKIDEDSGTAADRVGILCSISAKGIYAYQGDDADRVAVTYYPFEDPRIVCFAALPEEPEPEQAEEAAEALGDPVEVQPAEEPSTVETAQEAQPYPEEPAAAEEALSAEQPAEEAEVFLPEPPLETIEETEAPRICYSDDKAEISFADENPEEPKQAEAEPERTVTADPELIAAMREMET